MNPAGTTGTDPAHPAEHTDHTARSRIPAAFRLQFVVPTLVTIPLLVFTVSWALALGIFLWIHAMMDGRDPASAPMYSGASQAALWTLTFMAGYAASHTFPFSLALSYSRRVFLTGAFLAFLAMSVVMGALFTLAATLGVLALLITQAEAWPTVWQWSVEQTPLTLAGWLLVPPVLLTLIDYWLIRRATP